MSKLIKKAKSSKLNESFQEANENTRSRESVVRQIKAKEHPRSYRFDTEVMNSLKNKLDRINEIAPKKVSEARLVKALIILSKEIDDDKIIKALKEVW
jgi:hypothetical protein